LYEAETANPLWAAAGRPVIDDLAATPAPPERVVELSQFWSYRTPRSKLTMQLLDGLLAVHQAGSFVAILHPFQSLQGHDSGARGPLLEREDRVEAPADACSFLPQKMSDHRHFLFSSPYALYAVDVSSLRDFSSSREREQWHLLVDSSDEKSPKLACRPLPLDEARLALISQRNDGQYLWCVLDLREQVQRRPLRDLSDVSVPIPLMGAKCHVENILGQCLAFATTEGHWVWRHADAANCKIDALHRTIGGDPGHQQLLPNRHDERGYEFHFLRHFVQAEARASRPSRFEWYYTQADVPIHQLWCYRVDCQTLDTTNPCCLDDYHGVVPLGPCGEFQRVLFCGNRRLFFEQGLQLRPVPEHGQIEDIERAAGAVFCDPVLVVIEPASGKEWSLTIRSIHRPNQRLALNLPPIMADPLVWSRWLFTIERGDGGTLVLNRRDLQPTATEVPSAGAAAPGTGVTGGKTKGIEHPSPSCETSRAVDDDRVAASHPTAGDVGAAVKMLVSSAHDE
jgi:hypothetical protein